MATSSIFTNVVIRDAETAERFASALEASASDRTVIKRPDRIASINSPDELSKFFLKEDGKI